MELHLPEDSGRIRGRSESKVWLLILISFQPELPPLRDPSPRDPLRRPPPRPSRRLLPPRREPPPRRLPPRREPEPRSPPRSPLEKLPPPSEAVE